MQTAFTVPNEDVLKEEFLTVHERVLSLVIQTEADYLKAVEIKKEIKSRIADVTERFAPAKQAAYEAHRRISELEKLALARLREVDQVVEKEITTYILAQQERERKRQEEERRVAEERAKREAEAEARRKSEEALNQAMAFIEIGKSFQAESIIEGSFTPAKVIPILSTPRPAVPKTEGLSTREVYSAEVYDLKALIVAVAQGRAPLACLKVDESFLNKQAGALKTEFNLPGVRVHKTIRTVTRGR